MSQLQYLDPTAISSVWLDTNWRVLFHDELMNSTILFVATGDESVGDSAAEAIRAKRFWPTVILGNPSPSMNRAGGTMLKFLLGLVLGIASCYVVVMNPDMISSAITSARAGVGGVTQLAGVGDDEGRQVNRDPERVENLRGELASLSWRELWQVMDGPDFDRRTAASQLLLEHVSIPIDDSGITVVEENYLNSPEPSKLRSGFSYLGLLAMNDVSAPRTKRLIEDYVKQNPDLQVCDAALWALGEVGNGSAEDFLFEVVGQPDFYGEIARERAFCSLTQSGRFSKDQRLQMIPRLIKVHDSSTGHRTNQHWALVALKDCAPETQFQTIDEWKDWSTWQ